MTKFSFKVCYNERVKVLHIQDKVYTNTSRVDKDINTE